MTWIHNGSLQVGSFSEAMAVHHSHQFTKEGQFMPESALKMQEIYQTISNHSHIMSYDYLTINHSIIPLLIIVLSHYQTSGFYLFRVPPDVSRLSRSFSSRLAGLRHQSTTGGFSRSQLRFLSPKSSDNTDLRTTLTAFRNGHVHAKTLKLPKKRSKTHVRNMFAVFMRQWPPSTLVSSWPDWS